MFQLHVWISNQPGITVLLALAKLGDFVTKDHLTRESMKSVALTSGGLCALSKEALKHRHREQSITCWITGPKRPYELKPEPEGWNVLVANFHEARRLMGLGRCARSTNGVLSVGSSKLMVPEFITPR